LKTRDARELDASDGSRGGRRAAVRGVIGGTLMGLANLVPGISGGTMLLAAGVYPGFIAAIAEITTLRFRLRSIVLLGAIVASAALAILMLAGSVRDLVVQHRWIMYSLFIGLTLGGVPMLWRMARPATPALVAAACVAFGLMCLMAMTGATERGGHHSMAIVFFSGLAGASAMILPGVSGGYLLLLLGQYEAILGTLDQLKRGLLGDASTGAGSDLSLVLGAMHVVIPLGLGVVAGVVGVSNLLKWLLERYEKATLGALLGLLLGAVVGLWPFQQADPPKVGDIVHGRVVTLESAATIPPEDWPVRRFDPTPRHWAGAGLFVVAGLLGTLLIGCLGREPAGSPDVAGAPDPTAD
jgi:putative membrane protein